MMLIPVMLLLAVQLPAAGSEAADKYVTVPKTIVNQDVPPIPIDIKKKMERYTQLKSAAFDAWDPRNKGMIVSTRLGNANTTQLYWVDKPMGKFKQLTDYKEPVRGAEFSPDPARKYFLFTKDVAGAENYQLFRYDLDKGEAKMISDGKSRHMAITFNHKGDTFAYVNNSRTGMLFDVYIMDPEKPKEAKLVYQANRPAYYIPAGWMHDDIHLLVVEYLSANKCNSILVDTRTGKSQNITPKSDIPQFFALGAASKDGKYFFGYTDRGSQYKRLVRVERESLKVEALTKDIPWDIDDVAMSKDMTKVVFGVNEGGLSRLYLMDPETSKYKPIKSIPEGLAGGMKFDPEGKRLFLNINNARLNNDAFELDLETMKIKRWTKSDTAGLNLDTFAMPELIRYPTFDKVKGKPRMIPAFYYKPTKKTGKPFPVIINIHGGPEAQYRPRFRGSFNYFINELGIAVIAPNVRGSNGYGKDYLLMDNAEKRESSVKDIGALLDWIATRPELDKKRVAVSGGSYGGYMVLASMFHYSHRLACGVDIVGISNFVTFLKNTSAYRRDLRRAEYGDERKIGEFLNKISPTTNAHLIKKPLFVIQGKNDPRVPASEAEQMVKTVKKNKVPVWYQMATNEGHGFSKKDNSDFMLYSIVRFYQEYLLK
jgi:dipeptidyl aminopeptidase/acylaminoacyl peptidase